MVQLSHLHMTIGKTVPLTIWTFVSKVMSLLFNKLSMFVMGFPSSSVGKESACNAEDLGLIPGLGRYPGEGNGKPLLYSCLENPIYRGAWQATVHGGLKESDMTDFTLFSGYLKKKNNAREHSNILSV